MNLGADSYINKSGSPETVYCELADAINKTVERKKSRELLAKSESKYRALVENSLQGISILQVAPLRLVFANDAMGKLLGYSSQELMVLSPEGIMGLVYNEDRAVFFGRMENRLQGEPAGASYEFRGVRKDGSIIWLSALANRVDYEGQPAVQGMYIDVNERKKTEEILRESEARYRELANSLPDIIFETDMKGRLVFANERAPEISGFSQGDLENGLNIMQFLLPEDRDRAMKTIQRLIAGGSYVQAEYTFVRKNRTTFPALITATPCISKNKVTGLRGLVLDITERKRTEERLGKEQQELNLIIDSSPIIIFYKDNEGKFIRVNEAFAKAQKIPKEEFFGKTVFNFFSTEIARGMANDDLAVLKSGRPRFGIIEQYESASGMRWVQTEKVPTFDKNGVSTGLVGFAQDITERKKAEQALQESEEKLGAIFEGAPDGIIVADSKTKSFVFANPRICEITGYSLKELFKLTVSDIDPEKDLPSVTAQFTQQVQRKITLATNVPVLRKDSQVVYCDVNSRSVKIGKQTYVVGFFRDVTERKQLERLLQVSEGRLKSIIENSSDQIFMIDGNLKYLSANKTLEDVLGKAPEEVIGKSLTELYDQETASRFSNNIKYVFETGKSMFVDEKMFVQGHEAYISSSLNPVQDDTGKVIAVTGIVRDITQRKKAEEANRFQANLLNQVGQAVIMVDNNRIIRFWNKAAEKLYGWQEEQALGHQITELMGDISPDESDEVLSKLMAGESWSTEAKIKIKDGTVVPVILNRTPIFKDDGEFSGAASITTDITLQKRTEADLNFSLESLSESLAKIQELNEKLRVVGNLTRHDVRNKLSAVTGYAYLLKKKHADQADIVEGLGRMEQAVKDSMRIFDFAKLYEQLGVEELAFIDVEAKINESIALFSGSLPKIINECPGLIVLADSFLRQMFYNFIDNTRKYGQKTTIIKIYSQKTDAGSLKLIYEDDGVGISAENKVRLFSEGFSTGGSTGFGLFLTKKMMDVYGWKIEENGELGKGAKFTITIPRCNKSGKENYQTV